MRTGIVSAVCSAVTSAWLATAGGAQGLASEETGMSGSEDQAIAIMLDFAERTGLALRPNYSNTSESTPSRSSIISISTVRRETPPIAGSPPT